MPTQREREECLNLLLTKWMNRREQLQVVHRLDRNVSGLLVFAQNKESFDFLATQFKEHTAERRYIAAVHGIVPDDEGTFESWLHNDERTLRMHSGPEQGGRQAITHWKVLERGRGATLLEVRLETGLRNQIRVHFSEAGFPLIGEKKYAENRQSDSRQGLQRIFLHAAILGFNHPKTRAALRFEAPLPPDLNRLKSRFFRKAKS